MIEALWENHRSHGYIWIVILKLCPLLTCSKFSTCKDAVFTERPTEHEATVWAPTNGGRHDLSAGSIMNPLTNQLCFPLSTVINLGCWVFSHYSWDMSPLSRFNMFLPRRNVQRLPGRMLPHRESSTPADGKMISHQGHHGMWKMLTQYATVFRSGETWWPGIQHRWKNCNFPSGKAVLQDLQAWNTIFSRLRPFSPWYLYVSISDLQVLRLRRQVSTTGARQAMMGKQPDRKASFSCHNLISDIFQSQSTINQLNGRSWNLKTFRLSLVRSPATTPQVALPLQTRSAMPTYPGAQYQPQPDAFGRPILDLSRNIHWHPIISSPPKSIKSGSVQSLSILLKLVTHKSTGMIVENQRT